MSVPDRSIDPRLLSAAKEEFLKKGYKIVYDPTIQIWHEDSSTIKKISGDAVAKAKFTLPNHVKARKMLVEYLDV